MKNSCATGAWICANQKTMASREKNAKGQYRF
jgi:hypothetical protein